MPPPHWDPPNTEVRSGALKLFMWRFVSRKAGISTFSFRTILNIASDSKLTALIGRFRQRLDLTDGRIGKLCPGSRVQSFPHALLIWHCIFVFYINCVLSKGTISVYVKWKAIHLNKLDVRKLCTRTELKTLQLNVNRNGSGIRQKQGVTEENANNKLTNPQCDLEEKVHSLPPWY